MEPGCWKDVADAVKAGEAIPGICWNHDHGLLTGKILDADELAPGDPSLPSKIRTMGAGALRIKVQYNMDKQLGRDAFSDVKGGYINEWSVGFMPDYSSVRYNDGKRYIGKVEKLVETSNVLAGASPGTMTMALKSATAKDSARVAAGAAIWEAFKATWSTAFVNDLPDSAFAIILPGGKKDDDGKTTPRSLRKLPHHGSDGKLDVPHLRNALARISQTQGLSDAQQAKAQAHLDRHASAAGVGDDGKAADEECQTCGGKGKIRDGHVTCPDCEGSGKMPKGKGYSPVHDGHDHEADEADTKMQQLPVLTGDEAQHNAAIQDAVDAIKLLIAQELAESTPEFDCIMQLCMIGMRIVSWAWDEAAEYDDPPGDGDGDDPPVLPVMPLAQEGAEGKADEPVPPTQSKGLPAYVLASVAAAAAKLTSPLTSPPTSLPTSESPNLEEWDRRFDDCRSPATPPQFRRTGGKR